MEELPAPRPTPAQPPHSDAEPVAALLSSYGGRLYSYFRLMLDDDASAKRAVADTLLAAVADEERPRDMDQYAPRLFTLARAKCRKYEPAIAVNAGQHWTIGGCPPGLPEIARRAVARLAPEVREVFLLSAPHNGLALPQLAEVLEVRPDAADDLRTEAGVEFARVVLSCAGEADFTEFTGTELCVRAEASLARDASEPAPSLPILSDPALAAFREEGEAPPEAVPPAVIPPASGPPTLTSLVSAPPVPAPPVPEPQPPVPPPYVPPAATTPGDPAFLELGHRLVRKRPRRRGRAALAWVSGGIAAMAALAIGANALMSRSGDAIRLAPSGATPAAVAPSVDPSAMAGSPAQSPRPRPSRTVPRPTYAIPQPSAPVSTTKAPAPVPARPSAKPTPKPTIQPPSPPASPSAPPSGSGSPPPPPVTSSP